VTLSARRRVALVELARQYNLMIVEDDVYRDLAYEGKPPPSLFALDIEHGGGAVIRLGSFSKILAPDCVWAGCSRIHLTSFDCAAAV